MSDSPRGCKCSTRLICPITWFIIFGMLNSIFVKLAMEVESQGKPIYGIHKFQKPWFLNTMTYIGMCFALPLYLIQSCRKVDNYPPITSYSFKDFCEFAIPAIADIFQGVVSAVTIAFVGISIDVMLKAGTLVGVALITHFIFKKRLPPNKWIASGIVVAALLIVGSSSVLNAGTSQTIHVGKGWVVLIICLKIISQLAYAVKISYEEYFTHSKGYNNVLITAFEGIWSTIISCFILLPIVQYIPSKEGNGICEDTIDSFIQIKNSTLLIIIIVVIAFLGPVYSFASVALTDRSSALVRSLIESLRTLLLWILQLIIFVVFTKVPSLYEYREIGEEWCNGSYLQCFGYLVLVLGILQYQGFPKFPCIKYELPTERKSDSQSMHGEINDQEDKDGPDATNVEEIQTSTEKESKPIILTTKKSHSDKLFSSVSPSLETPLNPDD